jgi:hypothetical protein
MVEVGRFDTRADAEVARSLLAAAGIPCVLAPDEAAGAYPIALSGGARVLVADADAHDAAVILSHHASSEEEQQ